MARTIVGWSMVILAGALTSSLVAQTPAGLGGGAETQAGQGFDVTVTPDGTTTFAKLAGTSGHLQKFTFRNTGTFADVYSAECWGLNGIVCTDVSPSDAIMLSPGQTQTVWATYSVPGPGPVTGQLKVRALGEGMDTGFVFVPIVGDEQAPTIALINHNRDNLERSACLVVGAGEAGAWMCGHLLLSHGLPGFTTLGKERSLALLYHSATAAPRAHIMVRVSQPTGTIRPDSVVLDVTLNETGPADTAKYSGFGGASAVTKQVGLSVDASSLASGIYPVEVIVKNVYPTTEKTATIHDKVIVVNRNDPWLAGGWGIAGVERLVPGQPVDSVSVDDILWIGGDGSGKRYQKLNATTWVAPLGGFRDTLVYSAVDTTYTRRLRHGVQVVFDGQGRHIRTVNRVGHTTTFHWGTGGRLDSVRVPPAGAPNRTYTLTYGGFPSVLDKITDPAGRVLDVSIVFGKLTAIKDPDSATDSTRFGYGLAAPYLISSRTNRAGKTTSYGYFHTLVSEVKVPIDQASNDYAVTEIWPWNANGLGLFTADTTTATEFEGPRSGVADNATFWVDRWGAPVKTENALGAVTTIVRGDAAFPAQVTKVTYPNGRIALMSYNSRGNLVETRDSTSHLGAAGLPTKVMAYEYNDADVPDSPTRVENALELGTSYTYHSTLDLTEQVTDSRGHKTKFFYQTSGDLKGQIDSVVEKDVTVWKEAAGPDGLTILDDLSTGFVYDLSGNAKTMIDPNGVATSYVRDVFGRITNVYNGIGTRTTVVLDPLNRVVTQKQPTSDFGHPGGLNPLADCRSAFIECGDYTVEENPPVTQLTTEYLYATPGRMVLDSVLDPRGVPRSYQYDDRFATKAVVNEAGEEAEVILDAAGLVLKRISANGDTTKFSYDVLGRRTSMAFPARPAVPSGSILGDSVSYSYDVMGNLLTARNIQTEIRRQYYADGSLRSKVTEDLDFSSVIDSAHYIYDAAGRLDEAHYDGHDVVNYSYDAAGDLNTMQLLLTVADTTATYGVSFDWGELGRRKNVFYGAGNYHAVSYAYDRTGILRKVYSTNDGVSNGNHFKFTVRTEEVDPVGHILKQRYECPAYGGQSSPGPCGVGSARTIVNRYNRLGMLVVQHYQQVGGYIDSMRYDASGNLIKRYHGAGGYPGWQEFTVPANSNRMTVDDLSDVTPGLYVSHSYDAAGARVAETPSIGGAANAPLKHNYHYDALGRLNGMTYYTWLVEGGEGDYNPHGGPNRCHYDADGQLFLPCDDAAGKMSYEGPNVATVRTGFGNWRVFHAPGVDNPLFAINRLGYDLVQSGQPILYVTDGGGRQYAAANPDGSLSSNYQTGSLSYFRWASGTANSQGFEPERSDVGNSTLSLFRNRAYDSRTGRWTQEDPLGLAGGLNLYQYGANNPVTFIDPFGLCPEEMRDKDGLCPGGLTVEQYQRVEEGISTIDDEEMREGLTEKLQTGGIRIGTAQQFERSPDSPMGSNPGSGNIYLNPDGSWEELDPGSLGFGLGHEVGHKVHYDQLAPDKKTSLPTLVGDPAFVRLMERFADSVSCSRGTHPGPGYQGVCSRWRKR